MFIDNICIFNLGKINRKFSEIFLDTKYCIRYLKSRYNILNIESGDYKELYIYDIPRLIYVFHSLQTQEQKLLNEIFWLNKEIIIKKTGVKENENILMDASEYELKHHPFFTHKIEMTIKIKKQIQDKTAILNIYKKDLLDINNNIFKMYNLL